MNGINSRLTAFIAEHGESLMRQIPGIRNGDADAIHDARVATRRMRAALSVFNGNDHPAWQAVNQQMRSLTRALGAARDLDIVAELLDETHRGRSRDETLDTFRRSVFTEREDARRTLIKALEATPLQAIVPTDRRRIARWWRPQSNLAASLQAQLRQDSLALIDAIEHASGVYFPKRTHAVRVHTKRLRYLVEVAMRTGQWRTAREAHLLARVQSVLGDLHDREVLLQRLAAVGDTQATALGAIRDRAVSDRDDLFDHYLALRQRVNDAARTIHDVSADTRRRWSIAAAAVALPAAFVAGLVTAGQRRVGHSRGSAQGSESVPSHAHLFQR